MRTLGKRSIPAATRLENAGRTLTSRIDSNEIEGERALLLSNDAQVKLGMIKDMRAGTCYLRDYDDEVQLARMQGSGLLVLNIGRLMDCDEREANRLSQLHISPNVDSDESDSLCEQAAVYMADDGTRIRRSRTGESMKSEKHLSILS